MQRNPGRPTVRAYVGLGANVGAAQDTLAAAVHSLAALPGARLAGVSRLYRTRPVGVLDQPDFLNAVVALDAPAGPDPATGALALVVGLKGLERAFGRQKRQRWGPRELDLDLLLFGDHEISVERVEAAMSEDQASGDVQWLEVPHPEAQERLFVLAPLADLAPSLQPPRWPGTVAALTAQREGMEGADAVRPVAAWVGHWQSDVT